MIQDTFFMIKPDVVKNQEIGLVLNFPPRWDLTILKLKMVTLTPILVKILYHEHKDKEFLKDLVTFMCSGPVVVTQLRGENAIEKTREMLTELRDAFGTDIQQNAVHASDSAEAAEYELGLFNLIERL